MRKFSGVSSLRKWPHLLRTRQNWDKLFFFQVFWTPTSALDGNLGWPTTVWWTRLRFSNGFRRTSPTLAAIPMPSRCLDTTPAPPAFTSLCNLLLWFQVTPKWKNRWSIQNSRKCITQPLWVDFIFICFFWACWRWCLHVLHQQGKVEKERSSDRPRTFATRIKFETLIHQKLWLAHYAGVSSDERPDQLMNQRESESNFHLAMIDCSLSDFHHMYLTYKSCMPTIVKNPNCLYKNKRRSFKVIAIQFAPILWNSVRYNAVRVQYSVYTIPYIA